MPVPKRTAADAIILGAGPAGCAAALRLVQAGARVVLYERRSAPFFKPGEIIEPTIRQSLRELGLVDRFDSLDCLMLAGSLSIWDDHEAVEFAGLMSPHGHGILIDRTAFECWLISEARAAGAIVLQGALNTNLVPCGSGWCLNVRTHPCNEYSIVSPIVIEATGRGSGMLGYGKRRHFDRLIALAAYVTADASFCDQRLVIEASEDGWWYCARLPRGRAVAVFLTDGDALPATPTGRRDLFAARLSATLLVRSRIPSLPPSMALRGVPASSSLRINTCGSNWVAIGEAAATYDPLSGRGVVAALAKGIAMARLLASTQDLARAICRYAEAEQATFADYLKERHSIYGRVRHRNGLFWQMQRHEPVAPLSPASRL